MAKAKAAKKATKTSSKSKDGNREFGFMLFLQRVQQTEIAERCGVSVQTISDWKTKDNWEAKRAAKTISIDELVGKALVKINEMLSEQDFNADAFAKAVAQLKTLKQRNTVDDEIMCFMDFQNYLMENRHREAITPEFIKRLTSLQDMFVKQRLGNL